MLNQWLKYVCGEFDFPDYTYPQLLDCITKIASNTDANAILNSILDEYSSDYNTDFKGMMLKMDEISKLVDTHPFVTYLLFCVLFLKPLRDFHQQKGLKESIWRETCLDVKYKMYHCINIYKICGIFDMDMDWMARYYRVDRFPMGRLQFEIVYLEEDRTIQGVSLKKGSPMINVHIPRSGEKLDREAVYASYARGAKFFEHLFPYDYVVFCCESYFFHESVLNILKEGTNIHKFVSDFTVFPYKDDKDYFEMWRVFDCYVDKSVVDSLPTNTSFRRDLVEYLKTGKPVGEGRGIFIYKK